MRIMLERLVAFRRRIIPLRYHNMDFHLKFCNQEQTEAQSSSAFFFPLCLFGQMETKEPATPQRFAEANVSAERV